MLRLSALAGLVICLLGSQPAPAQQPATCATTYAAGSPTTSVSTVDTTACQNVNHATRRRVGSVTTSAIAPGRSECEKIASKGHAKNTARNPIGIATRAMRTKRAARPS